MGKLDKIRRLVNGETNHDGTNKARDNYQKKTQVLHAGKTGNDNDAWGGQSSGITYNQVAPGTPNLTDLNGNELNNYLHSTTSSSPPVPRNGANSTQPEQDEPSVFFNDPNLLPKQRGASQTPPTTNSAHGNTQRYNSQDVPPANTETAVKRRAINPFSRKKEHIVINHETSFLDDGPPALPPKPNELLQLVGAAQNGDVDSSLNVADDGLSPFSDAHETQPRDPAAAYTDHRRKSAMRNASQLDTNVEAGTADINRTVADDEPSDVDRNATTSSQDAKDDTNHNQSQEPAERHVECEREIPDLKAVRSQLQAEMRKTEDKLKKRIAELESDKINLEQLKQAREDSLAELRGRTSTAEDKGRQMSKRIGDLIKELSETKTALERSGNEHNAVKDKLRVKVTEAINASNMCNLYLQRNQQLTTEISKHAARLQDVEPLLKDTQEELGRANRQVEALQRTVRNLESTRAAQGQKIEELNGYVGNAKIQINELALSNNNYVEIINDLRPRLSSAKQGLKDRTEELSRVRDAHSIERDGLQTRLNTANGRINQVIQETDSKILDAEAKATRAIQTWEAEKAEEIDKLKAIHNAELFRVRDEHATATNDLRTQLQGFDSKAEREKAEIKSNHKMKAAEIMAQHEKKVTELNARLLREQREHQDEINEVTEDLRAELILKAKEYEKATEQLREDVQTLNSRLLTHDDQNFEGEIFAVADLPDLPDGLIQKQFSDIAHIVDSLSRIEWRSEPAVWTRNILQVAGGQLGDRMLKKAIMQDTVWSVLFRYVFCSPFRMFGSEGELLEQQWSSQCGPGSEDDNTFTWPRPGAKAERWRFITVKNCRDTLLPPQPSEWDPRRRVMKDYLKNLNDCRSALIVALENLADLKDESVGYINQLPKKAATIGMQFAMHRCRIVVEMNASMAMSMNDKAQAARNGKIELTRTPAVRRYGNVMGINLDQSQIIGNLTGDIVVVP